MAEKTSDIIRKLKKAQKKAAILIPLSFSPLFLCLGVFLSGNENHKTILYALLLIILFAALLLFMYMIKNKRYEKMKQDLGLSNDDELNYYLGNSRRINEYKFINDDYLIDLPPAKLYRLADIKNAERYNKKVPKNKYRSTRYYRYYIKLELSNGKKGKLNFWFKELEREYAYILISKAANTAKNADYTSIVS
ncbi:MAG: hypothetical protein IJK31_04745 [Ruminococcus sp.]|nr:hypothetical protein [Ruminococcus sp.]